MQYSVVKSFVAVQCSEMWYRKEVLRCSAVYYSVLCLAVQCMDSAMNYSYACWFSAVHISLFMYCGAMQCRYVLYCSVAPNIELHCKSQEGGIPQLQDLDHLHLALSTQSSVSDE